MKRYSESKERGCPNCDGDSRNCCICLGKTRLCDWVETVNGWRYIPETTATKQGETKMRKQIKEISILLAKSQDVLDDMERRISGNKKSYSEKIIEAAEAYEDGCPMRDLLDEEDMIRAVEILAKIYIAGR
jgi:hypothetical protein